MSLINNRERGKRRKTSGQHAHAFKRKKKQCQSPPPNLSPSQNISDRHDKRNLSRVRIKKKKN